MTEKIPVNPLSFTFVIVFSTSSVVGSSLKTAGKDEASFHVIDFLALPTFKNEPAPGRSALPPLNGSTLTTKCCASWLKIGSDNDSLIIA